MMTGKDRLRKALAHQEPDRVPVGEMGIDSPIIEDLLGHSTYYRAQGKERQAIWAGERDKVVTSQKKDLVELVRLLEWDLAPVWITYSASADNQPLKFISADHLKWQDKFGNIWQAPDAEADALCIETPEYPPELLSAMLQSAPVIDPSQLELINHVVCELGDTHFIVGRGWHAPSYWTDGSFPLPGEGFNIPIDKFLLMMYEAPEMVHAILDAHTQRAIEHGKVMIEAGVDAILVNADYGINTGPWLSPRFFRQFILPYLQRQVRAFQEMGAYVIKHTDGFVLPLLDMLVETGIDGLHGIQPSLGMSLDLLKNKYGERITFFGAVESDTLINGNPQDVRLETARCIQQGAPGGGFVLTTSNSVQAGVKTENYQAMLAQARLTGSYPIYQGGF